ncbi:MAG: glycosyltransferase family 39 protein [Campylobacteraceae bacterium]|nr:glycosyltransferase family 39 protein [Campylobacteraceae bacterium]
MTTFLLKQKIFIIAFIYILLAIAYNTYLPFFEDEAYYWLWSHHLALSYFDHPPMIAYQIKLFTTFGDAVWQIRMVNIFCMFGAGYFIYKTARYLFDEKTAFYAFLIFIFSPAVTMGLVITTPDSPLAFFWAASLYLTAKAFFEGKTRDFILAGALGGAALLSKYTGILLFMSYFIFIASYRPKLFVSKKLYLAILFGLIIFSPVIIWNIQNDFSSFLFQYYHGSSTGGESIGFNHDLELFGGAFGIFGPVFFALLLYLFTQKEFYKNERLFFVLSITLLTLLFFLYKGLYKKMELNWVAPAFASASIVVGYFIAKNDMKKTLIWGLIISLLIGGVMKFPLFFGLEGARNPHNRLFGQEELAKHIEHLTNENVYTDYLTMASALTYYLKKDVYIPTQTRKSQFDTWQQGHNFASKPGIYVARDGDKLNELKTIWSNSVFVEEYTIRKKGFKDKKYYIYRVSN